MVDPSHCFDYDSSPEVSPLHSTSAFDMLQLTGFVETFPLGKRHGTHFWMKIFTIFSFVASKSLFCPMFEEFVAHFWMCKLAGTI